MPIGQMEAIYIFSGTDINQHVLILLDEYDIAIFFFTYNGRFIGRYMPNQTLAGQHIINHVHFIDDSKAVVKLRKSLLLGAIKNMMFVAKYYQKKRQNLFPFIEELEKALRELPKISSGNSFLTLEARAKQAYYGVFDLALLEPGFSFIQRSTRPPLNEINAMLSFGYALLYSRLEGSIHRSRLCLELPFQHGYSKKGSGLQHDIADVFKPIMVDRLVLKLINKKNIRKEHFEARQTGIFLTKEGMTIFITEFEESMGTTIDIKGKKYTYQQVLSREVHQISNLVNEGKKYKPFILTKW